MKKFFLFVFALLLSFLPGVMGFLFSPGRNIEVGIWYDALMKSTLNPAGWVFSVAWGILYLLLGIALYMIIVNKAKKQMKKSAYWLFAINIVFNALWSWLFFGLGLIGLSFFNIIILLGIAVWMSKEFYQISKPAGYMVWPYIVWLAFALYLNGMIMLMN